MNPVLMLRKLALEEEGADATEYGLLAALIAVALIFGATALGTKINGVFNTIQGNMP
jgi:pilus assembly protein Flp/PilA